MRAHSARCVWGVFCVCTNSEATTVCGFCHLRGLCGSFTCVRACTRVHVCVIALRISLCIETDSAREHGETLFTVCFFFPLPAARPHDSSRRRSVRGLVVEAAVGGCWIRRGVGGEGAGRDGGGVIRRLTGEPLSFMLIEGARTELHRQLTCPSRCSLWFSTSVKTGSHFVSPLFICLTTQNIMEHRGAQ